MAAVWLGKKLVQTLWSTRSLYYYLSRHWASHGHWLVKTLIAQLHVKKSPLPGLKGMWKHLSSNLVWTQKIDENYLSKVSWMVLVKHNPVVMLSTSITTTPGMLPMFSNTPMPSWYMTPLLPVLLQSYKVHAAQQPVLQIWDPWKRSSRSITSNERPSNVLHLETRTKHFRTESSLSSNLYQTIYSYTATSKIRIPL